MFGSIFSTAVIIIIVYLIIIAVALTAIKLGIYTAFDFVYEKSLWLYYIVFYSIALLVISLTVIIIDKYNLEMVLEPIQRSYFAHGMYLISLVIIAPLTLIEYFYFYNKHFNYESKKKYIVSLVVGYIADSLFLLMGSYFLTYVIMFIVG